jgi:ribosomal protein L3 glutamine methyltransferase
MTKRRYTTIRDLLRHATTNFNAAGLFFGHGSDNAFDEAVYLILHTLKLPLDKIEPFLDAHLLESEVEAVLRVIDIRIADRIPAAYITNEAWLGDYRFYVDQRAIVPRSFIAELIPNNFLPWISTPEAVSNVLELCTGSGCLAIMLAEAFQAAHIDATDISSDALNIAHRNIQDYNLQSSITLIESDLYSGVPPENKYDLIVTNPPYVNSTSMDKLPSEYTHEPQIALKGGYDGMKIVREIIARAKEYLTEKGVLVVEVGNESATVEKLFKDLEIVWLPTSVGSKTVFLITAEQLP